MSLDNPWDDWSNTATASYVYDTFETSGPGYWNYNGTGPPYVMAGKESGEPARHVSTAPSDSIATVWFDLPDGNYAPNVGKYFRARGEVFYDTSNYGDSPVGPIAPNTFHIGVAVYRDGTSAASPGTKITEAYVGNNNASPYLTMAPTPPFLCEAGHTYKGVMEVYADYTASFEPTPSAPDYITNRWGFADPVVPGPAIQVWAPTLPNPIRLSRSFRMTIKATGLRHVDAVQAIFEDGQTRWLNADPVDNADAGTYKIDSEFYTSIVELGSQVLTVIAYGVVDGVTATASVTVTSNVPPLTPVLNVHPNPAKAAHDVTLTSVISESLAQDIQNDFGFGDGSPNVVTVSPTLSTVHQYAALGNYPASLDVARPYQRRVAHPVITMTKFNNANVACLVLPLGENLSLLYWSAERGITIVDGYLYPIAGKAPRYVGRIIDHSDPLNPVVGPEHTLAGVMTDTVLAGMQGCSLVVLPGNRILAVWAGFETAWGYRKRYQVTSFSGTTMTSEGTGGDLPARDGHIDTQFDTDDSWTSAFGEKDPMPMGAVSATRVLMTNREADSNVEYYGVEYVLMELPADYSGQATEVSTAVGAPMGGGWRSSFGMTKVGSGDFLNRKAGSSVARVRVVGDTITETAFLDGTFGGPRISILNAEDKWWHITSTGTGLAASGAIAEIDLTGAGLALVNSVPRLNGGFGSVSGYMADLALAVEVMRSSSVLTMGQVSGSTYGFRTFVLGPRPGSTPTAIDRQDLMEDGGGLTGNGEVIVGSDHVIVPTTMNAFTDVAGTAFGQMLNNPTGDGTTITGWTDPLLNTTTTTSTTRPRTGTRSFRQVFQDDGDSGALESQQSESFGNGNQFRVTPGTTFTASGWGSADAGWTPQGRAVLIFITEHAVETRVEGPLSDLTDSYSEFSVSGAAPMDTMYMKVRWETVGTHAPGNIVRWDDLSLSGVTPGMGYGTIRLSVYQPDHAYSGTRTVVPVRITEAETVAVGVPVQTVVFE